MGELIEGSVPPIEISLDLIRIKRNELLSNCDFVFLPIILLRKRNCQNGEFIDKH